MIIGVLTLEFFLEYSHSLKEKRRFLQSFTDRLKQRFNVSVSEIAFQDSWQRATIAVAVVNSQHHVVEQVLTRILDEARSCPEALLSGHQLSYY
jgi:uncharacterized protein YlxP (DUF503 family)